MESRAIADRSRTVRAVRCPTDHRRGFELDLRRDCADARLQPDAAQLETPRSNAIIARVRTTSPVPSIGDDPCCECPMNWVVLMLAGLFEVGWAIGLKYTNGFSRFWPSVGTVLAMLTSIGLL